MVPNRYGVGGLPHYPRGAPEFLVEGQICVLTERKHGFQRLRNHTGEEGCLS